MSNTPEWPRPEAGGTPNPQGGYGAQEPAMNSGGNMPPYNPGGQMPPQTPNYSYAAPGVPLVEGNGKVQLVSTIGKAFSLFGRAAGPWIGGAAISLVAIVVVSTIGALPGALGGELTLGSVFISSVITSMVIAFVTVYLGNGALQVVEGRQLTFKQFFVLKHGLQKPVYVAYITAFITGFLTNLATYFLGFATSGMVMFAGVLLLVALLISPVLWVAAYYSLDHGYGLGDALSHCVSDSIRNYLPILGLLIIVGFLSMLGMLAFGFGLLLMLPVTVLVAALVYRQMSRGVHVAL